MLATTSTRMSPEIYIVLDRLSSLNPCPSPTLNKGTRLTVTKIPQLSGKRGTSPLYHKLPNKGSSRTHYLQRQGCQHWPGEGGQTNLRVFSLWPLLICLPFGTVFCECFIHEIDIYFIEHEVQGIAFQLM